MSLILVLTAHIFEVLAASLLAVFGIACVLLRKRPDPIRMAVARGMQSKPTPGGDGNARVNALLGEDCKLLDSVYNGEVKTLYDGFQRGLRLAKDLPYLGKRQPNRPYQFQTYAQVQERITNFGSGLINRGHIAGQGTFVGIASRNCPEWVIVEQACNAYSQVLVPLYDTLGPEAIEHIVTQANTEVVVLSADKFIDRFRVVASTKVPKLVVKIGRITSEDAALAVDLNTELVMMETIETEGKITPVSHHVPHPDDLCTICYTSGTTGKPKGVMLTHRNIIADCAGAMAVLESQSPFTTEDHYISYLPLAHMYERSLQSSLTMNGSKIYFYQGNIKLLMEDIAECRPTIFISVPRLLNRIYDKTKAAVSASFIKRTLYEMAMRSKQIDIDNGIVCNSTIWDKLVFKKIQASLGGRLRLTVSAAAPLGPEVLNFLRCALGCFVLEGYGQTESTAGATLNFPGESIAGHVGPPLPCNIIKLIDVPEMEYYAKNGEGEVCFKGPNVFKGYFNDEAKTREALDADGWLHSGDIGKWYPNGCLKIIDRKKQIVKLSNGEYIAPEKIENCYTRHPAVMQAFVHANSLYPFPIAILVPDPDTFPGWAEKKGVKGRSLEEMCQDKELTKQIISELDDAGKEYGLNPFERIKQMCFVPEQFTVENDMLTPTMKFKRYKIVSIYQDAIDKLYERMKEAGATK